MILGKCTFIHSVCSKSAERGYSSIFTIETLKISSTLLPVSKEDVSSRHTHVQSIWPPPPLLNVIRVNQLRPLVTQGIIGEDGTTMADAEDSLDCITISPRGADRTQRKRRLRQRLILLGRIYQSAVILYCILPL
ncbi:hypothetical protein F5X99DRAFT_375624 [Biscogniauxia marginata]|nr:hypothetical protein F5X99DRAFT_375624 [Biscogniauxia marginata]